MTLDMRVTRSEYKSTKKMLVESSITFTSSCSRPSSYVTFRFAMPVTRTQNTIRTRRCAGFRRAVLMTGSGPVIVDEMRYYYFFDDDDDDDEIQLAELCAL